MSRLQRHHTHLILVGQMLSLIAYFYTFVSGSYLQLPILVGCGGPVDKVTKVNPPGHDPSQLISDHG